jgi:hypothetical protein
MEKVGKINIDFNVYSTVKNLKVEDNSEWVYAEKKKSYISIIIPGSKKEINFTFEKKRRNVFNSHNLGLSCLKGDCTEEVYVDLPDGIYTITVKSAYIDIQKTSFYLKTDLFERELAKTAIRYGIEYQRKDEFLKVIVKIQGLLFVAKSHAFWGDFHKSQNFFNEAKDVLNKLNDI